MNINESNFSNNQKKAIYKQVLQPIKLKISQILLYDTEKAIEFLSEYNEIIKKEDEIGAQIFNYMEDLNIKIDDYQKTGGKENRVRGQTRAILEDIEELDTKNYQLTIGEFSDAFSNLEERYNTVGKYNLQERDQVENKFYELQIKLITRLIKETQYTTLKDIIKEQDESGLHIAIARKTNEFLQSENLAIKNKAQKISNILMTDNNAVYSKEIWTLLDELQEGKNIDYDRMIGDGTTFKNSVVPNTTALTVVPEKKGLSFVQKLSKLFSEEPELPLQLEDLKKIDMDWLAKHIPQQMLEETERNRLKAEKKEADKIFIPHPKTPIYDMLTAKRTDRTFNYIDNNGIEKKARVDRGWYEITFSTKNGQEKFDINLYQEKDLVSIINYALLIDEIFGTNWNGNLLYEIERCRLECGKEWFKELPIKKLKTYKNFKKSYENLKKEYEDTKLDFRASEDARRESFYEKYKFKEKQRQHSKESYNITDIYERLLFGELYNNKKKEEGEIHEEK